MDKLQQCAGSFEHLLDKKYHIIIGRKGKTIDLNIVFDPVDFHHLAGLNKLKDLRLSRQNREKVFVIFSAVKHHFSILKKAYIMIRFPLV